MTAYGRLALEALRAAVADVKRDDPMAPVTVLVPNNIAGIVARRFLAHGLIDTEESNGVAGIYFSTLPRLAEQLAAPTLTAAGRRPATRPVTAATIRRRLDADPGIFEPVADHPATSRALAQAMTALRDVDDATLTTLESASSLVRDVVRLHRETSAELEQQWYDATDLLKAATVIVRRKPSATTELGPVLLYLPQDLTRAETAFAQSFADRTDLHVIAGLTGNARADLGVVATLAALAPEFQPCAGTDEPFAARILNASDSDDEVRCVVREVVQRLQSVPAHRIAILYAERSPYARLLHEHLGSAGITTNGPGVRPVNERAVSRLALGLLKTGRTDFRRADVLRTLGEVGARDFAGERISVSRWERISREAGVVAGRHWDTRLATYIAMQASTIETERHKDEPYESTIARAERNRETAIALRQFMKELQEWFVAVTGPRTWVDLAAWARGLLHPLIPPDDMARMPLEEQYAAEVIERTLSGLAALDETGSTPTVEGLEEVLALELESALPRVGRFGEGVLVAPVTQAIGLDLDVVYLVGLSEDLFPGRLRDDSLLPERVRAMTAGQLPSTRARVNFKQRSLLAAFTSASQVITSFPRGDLRRHTDRLPSRWLLPTLRHLSGNPSLAATEWKQAGIDKKSGEWLATSPSYAGSLLTTDAPSTGQEWRVRAVSAHLDLFDAALTAALTMGKARESDQFTRFDGNLAQAPGLPNFADGTRRVSPTRLERYAICPHEYFVKRMLNVEPIEEPEEQVEISVLDIGNLIHESFDALIIECSNRGELPGYGEPWTDRQRQRLQEIGSAKADEYEAAGLTGHRTVWKRTRASLLATLGWMLCDDERWRAGEDARVLTSELAFGLGGASEVRIQVDGGELRFQGSADKVDQRRDDTLLVTDLKSGSATAFKKLSEDNPVQRGEKLQLPVYAQAARARFGGADTRVEAMYWFVRKDRGKRVQVPLTDVVEQTYAETVGLIARSMADGVFPARAPAEPDFRWVACRYCNPDGLGHADVRRRWETMRLAPELRHYTALVEPEALPAETRLVGDDGTAGDDS
ncbi:MAG: PD-(D/E)XK nuclease family protein [Actinobacteria bacterium]|nr:PD-(D/E)XK nuclease family protein [Actinomycetota bacterium]